MEVMFEEFKHLLRHCWTLTSTLGGLH